MIAGVRLWADMDGTRAKILVDTDWPHKLGTICRIQSRQQVTFLLCSWIFFPLATVSSVSKDVTLRWWYLFNKKNIGMFDSRVSCVFEVPMYLLWLGAGELSLVVMTGLFDCGIWSGMSVFSNLMMAWGISNLPQFHLCIFYACFMSLTVQRSIRNSMDQRARWRLTLRGSLWKRIERISWIAG